MSIDGQRTWDPTSQMRALASPIRNYERELIEVLDRHSGNMAPAYDESCRSCTACSRACARRARRATRGLPLWSCTSF